MRNCCFGDEADACRGQALLFAHRPEADFLMRLAQSFEELQAARPVEVDGETGADFQRVVE